LVILNSRKLIFVHIHKAGGTSIEASLEPLMKWNDIILGGTPWGEYASKVYLKKFNLEKHSPAWWIRETVGAELWSRYFTWATVRDPYARIASLYSYLAAIVVPLFRQAGYPEHERQEVQRAWLESSEHARREPWCYPGVRAFLLTRSLARPFSEFLRHPDLEREPGFTPQFVQIADRARREIIVTKAVKLESLNAFWPEFCALSGIGAAPLVTANETDKRFKKPVSELLSSRDDRDFVNRIYADDFRLLGYERI
jgi:hypothetical protein